MEDRKKRFTIILLIFLLLLNIIFIQQKTYQNHKTETSLNQILSKNDTAKPQPDINRIERVEYSSNLLDDYTGYALIGRVTCKYCAILYDYLTSIQNLNDKFVYISLEELYGGPNYDSSKKALSITEIPIIRYYQHGKLEREMECPLDTGYTDETDFEYKRALYNDMADRINRFLSGEEVDAKYEVEMAKSFHKMEIATDSNAVNSTVK